MEMHDYIVSKIDGEYAILTDVETKNDVFIAMALLPAGVDVGCSIHYEMFEYTIA